MSHLYHFSFLAGLLLIAVANLGMRRPGAPPIGGGGFRWPWQMRDRLTDRGYRLHLAGLVLWMVAPVLEIGACAGDRSEGEARLMGMQTPVHLVDTVRFEDGGTVGFVLVDATGDTLYCCYDGRIRQLPVPRDGRVPDLPPRHWFIGALHPVNTEVLCPVFTGLRCPLRS